jgi:hypothetical protein
LPTAGLYATEELGVFYGVVAVRAELSPLVPLEFVDPAALGLAKPMTELVWEGDVSCQAAGDGLTDRINATTSETSAHLADLAHEIVAASS